VRRPPGSHRGLQEVGYRVDKVGRIQSGHGLPYRSCTDKGLRHNNYGRDGRATKGIDIGVGVGTMGGWYLRYTGIYFVIC